MANKDHVLRRITVADPEAWDDPAEGSVSRADVTGYLLAQGWKREGEWFLSGPEGEQDRIPARRRVTLAKLVAHVAMAEGRAPRSVLRDIEASADAPPDTERERPLFRELRIAVPPDRGMGPFIAAATEIDGYRIVRVDRKGTTAIVRLRRIDPGEEG